ncbi:MAG TPA: hypothetical protein DEQ84_04740, partial [Prevotellaceae bacterium]|nr:hypothetical protein [Prevotellaceae bacterium]
MEKLHSTLLRSLCRSSSQCFKDIVSLQNNIAMNIKASNVNSPDWKVVTVQSQMPEALKCLDEIAHNLWWTWNTDAYYLFRNLNYDLFKSTGKNVVEMLGKLSYEELTKMSEDKVLLAKIDNVYKAFK